MIDMKLWIDIVSIGPLLSSIGLSFGLPHIEASLPLTNNSLIQDSPSKVTLAIKCNDRTGKAGIRETWKFQRASNSSSE